MPAPYSRDLRERLLAACAAGRTTAEIACGMDVSERSLRRWRARLRDGLSLEPASIPGRPRLLSPEQEDHLVAQVAATPDATVEEYRDRFVAEHGDHVPAVSVSTVGRILRQRGLPLNKSR